MFAFFCRLAFSAILYPRLFQFFCNTEPLSTEIVASSLYCDVTTVCVLFEAPKPSSRKLSFGFNGKKIQSKQRRLFFDVSRIPAIILSVNEFQSENGNVFMTFFNKNTFFEPDSANPQ